MLFDQDVVAKKGSRKQARGFLILRNSLFLTCVQDIAKYTADADYRTSENGCAKNPHTFQRGHWSVRYRETRLTGSSAGAGVFGKQTLESAILEFNDHWSPVAAVAEYRTPM